jgi:hypothetical protein
LPLLALTLPKVHTLGQITSPLSWLSLIAES